MADRDGWRDSRGPVLLFCLENNDGDIYTKFKSLHYELLWLVGFYGISTLSGYLMLPPVYTYK